MTASVKIETIGSKIDQNKAHCDLGKQTAKISALAKRSITKYNFLTSKYVLPDKYLLEEGATFKRFEY